MIRDGIDAEQGRGGTAGNVQKVAGVKVHRLSYGSGQ